MKNPPSITAVIFSILIVSCCSIIHVPQSQACTVFNKSEGNTVLFGNVENEQPHYTVELQFVPPEETPGPYGHFYFYYNGNIGGGMNDQGLCFDVAALPEHDINIGGRPYKDLMNYLLQSCETVDDAIDFFATNSWYGHRFNHLMVFDKTGASAIIEHIGSSLYIFHKEGNSQVMTNYSIADSELRLGEYPCSRFIKTTEMLDTAAVTIDNFQHICEKVSRAYYGALYANIYDPNSLDIHIFNANIKGSSRATFNLQEEFKKGSHHYILKNNNIISDLPESGNKSFIFSENAPNPFYSKTSFSLTLTSDADINISIFNLNGQRVDLLEDERLAPGDYTYTWQREDLPKGIYICRLQLEGIIETRKWLKQ